MISYQELAEKPRVFKSITRLDIEEFERLFGKTENDFDRNELQVLKAQELGVYIVLKGAHTCVATPGGNSYYNTTGNPGMATGGSGDVLTGLITGLLAQGYHPKEAAILAVYLHGKSADIAIQYTGHETFTASQILDYLSDAILDLIAPETEEPEDS